MILFLSFVVVVVLPRTHLRMEDGSEDEDGDNAQHEDGGDGTEAELSRLLQQPHQNQHHQQAVGDGENGAV